MTYKSLNRITFALCLIFFSLEAHLSSALDPKFEIDLKTLRPKKEQQIEVKGEGKKEKKSPASGKNRNEIPGRAAGAKTREGTPASSPAKDKKNGAPQSPAKAQGKSLTRPKADTAAPGTGASAQRTSPKRSKVSKRGISGQPATRLTLSLGKAPRMDREDILLHAKKAWDRILAKGPGVDAPVSLKGRNFSITLDPVRYPVFHGLDGAKMVIDADGSLPPLMKSIIEEKEPAVRFVTERPENTKRFYSVLLAATGFYSVEEDFSISFGSDPKITVFSDFKIEKSPESVLNNDILLLNVSDCHVGMPPSLRSFLDREGFGVIEASPPAQISPGKRKHLFYSVKGFSQRAMVDSVLRVASEGFTADREIELDDGSRSGVTMTVKADRYLEGRGRKIVISFSDDNPVQQSLLKLLQAKGYQVVAILPDDGFRQISEKIFASLNLAVSYGTHHLWDPRNTLFDVQMSGFMIKGAARKQGMSFITDLGVDSVMRELLNYQGYDVVEK